MQPKYHLQAQTASSNIHQASRFNHKQALVSLFPRVGSEQVDIYVGRIDPEPKQWHTKQEKFAEKAAHLTRLKGTSASAGRTEIITAKLTVREGVRQRVRICSGNGRPMAPAELRVYRSVALHVVLSVTRGAFLALLPQTQWYIIAVAGNYMETLSGTKINPLPHVLL